MKNDIFNRIIRYIKEHDILYNYDSYEQMPIFHTLSELDCLSSFVKKEYYKSFCINMAIMYVNQGLLHAKSNLSDEEFQNYIIYFYVCINKKDDDFAIDVVFSRKAKEQMSTYEIPINIHGTTIYDYVKDVVGINDFSCYFYKNEFDDEFYIFVPQILEHKK